mmetsp:Transcript_7605/g.12643  ORF Transcript_7605/g.12643 Transcript_7605/m.12643 type:complete len:516 (+) Transcript_7605:89-1636(+)|eukprot:CAMPEP_0175009834 /NCGR_PEP_ID=MMETSP0005-20121125/7771_1 /TAXON_ID=420556 /ORGANISM="Ochromonas sp., Strain CCMP1393" /LENGTH=515 /DNA_ID=CAMNT_0016265599 /DNA_START=164 /DNA_END=1711 /DNA_ORIENTATION=-
MSTVEEVAKLEGFKRGCCRPVEMRIPFSRPVDFISAFQSSSGSEEAAAFIQKLNDSRIELINSLGLNHTNEQKLSAVNAYLPHLLRLVECYKTQPEIKTDRDLVFEWKTSMMKITDPSPKSSDILYEMIMILQTKAAILTSLSKSLLDTDPVAFLPDAGKHTLEAASIYNYLALNLASPEWTAWKKIFNKRMPPPPDFDEHVCYGLASMLKAQAQSMSFLKIVTSGGSAGPTAIKARLCVGVINSCIASLEQFTQASGGGLTSMTTYAPYATHNHITKQFYTALAYQYGAQQYLEKKEVGNAMAYCNAAKACFVEQKSSVKNPWMGVGLPKLVGPYVELAHFVKYTSEEIDKIFKAADRDNKFVYFQVVPTGNGVPQIPAEASVMNPPVYSDPPGVEAPVELKYVAKPSIPGIVSSIFSWGNSKPKKEKADAPPAADADAATSAEGEAVEAASAAAAAAAATGNITNQMSADEAYARSLQQQYNSSSSAPPSAPPPPAAPAAGGAPVPPRYNSLV